MELELKHIVGYLGHDLKIQDRENIFSLDYFYNHILPEEYRSEFGNIGLQQLLSDDYLKPILRQLYHLTKEIEVNGEKFVPIDFLEGMFGDCSKLTDTMLVNSFVPYGIVKKLYEWHFDIHGLIEAGLDIDINTLK